VAGKARFVIGFSEQSNQEKSIGGVVEVFLPRVESLSSDKLSGISLFQSSPGISSYLTYLQCLSLDLITCKIEVLGDNNVGKLTTTTRALIMSTL